MQCKCSFEKNPTTAGHPALDEGNFGLETRLPPGA
jgi:hypothetical protein